jgi:hypothetical protein
MKTTIDEQLPQVLRIFIAVCLFLAMLVAPIFMMVLLFLDGHDDGLTPLIKANPQAWLGVPWAGGAALIVVLLFKPIFGEMEFKGLGFEFKGSSGPAVLWALCFLAEIGGIVALYSAGH